MKNRKSLVLLVLLSVGTTLPSDYVNQARNFVEQAWGSPGRGGISQRLQEAIHGVQLWVAANPKSAGALMASAVGLCLFLLWRKHVAKRVERELGQAWMDGYKSAQTEIYFQSLSATAGRQAATCDNADFWGEQDEVSQFMQELHLLLCDLSGKGASLNIDLVVH